MDNHKTILSNYFSPYNNLTNDEIELIIANSVVKSYKKNNFMLQGDKECAGLIIALSGQIRVFTVSEDGKEITLYRLIEGDTCILSASCILKDITFTINISFEQDSDVLIIPSYIYEKINSSNPKVKEYTLNLVSGRFSEVMWILQQYIFFGVARRLGNALIEQAVLNGGKEIVMTHEQLANEIGTAREVITRLLKQFKEDGLINMKRNYIELLDVERIRKL